MGYQQQHPDPESMRGPRCFRCQMTTEPLKEWKFSAEWRLHTFGIVGRNDYLEKLFNESANARSWFDDDLGPNQPDYSAAYAT